MKTMGKQRKLEWEVKDILAIAESNPERLIGVNTNRVYSQIARMGRNPDKQEAQAILISALEDAIVKIEIDGKTVKKDPPFVPVKAYDLKNCFGKQLKKLSESSVFWYD